ncbi:MAG TPA: phosphoglycerate mutase family protein [Fredinandcohnia sp.]|nr:phosphoglycerate mutase family protein [Fredinandcohnia sp.]
MRIYLLRHGEAVPPGEGVQEEDRPLTVAGRRRVRESARAWSLRDDPVPQSWFVSPYVRAVQTCEICVSAFGADADVDVSRSLLPTGRVSQVVDLIVESGKECVAVVGHQPLLGGVAAFLLHWSTVPAHLDPGAILALDLGDEGPARLVWHAVPARDERGPLFLAP